MRLDFEQTLALLKYTSVEQRADYIVSSLSAIAKTTFLNQEQLGQSLAIAAASPIPEVVACIKKWLPRFPEHVRVITAKYALYQPKRNIPNFDTYTTEWTPASLLGSKLYDEGIRNHVFCALLGQDTEAQAKAIQILQNSMELEYIFEPCLAYLCDPNRSASVRISALLAMRRRWQDSNFRPVLSILLKDSSERLQEAAVCVMDHHNLSISMSFI
jgi:hypothetical protein